MKNSDTWCLLDLNLIQVRNEQYSFRRLLQQYDLNLVYQTEDFTYTWQTRRRNVQRLWRMVKAYEEDDKEFLDNWPKSYEDDCGSAGAAGPAVNTGNGLGGDSQKSDFGSSKSRKSTWSILSRKLPYILGGLALAAGVFFAGFYSGRNYKPKAKAQNR